MSTALAATATLLALAFAMLMLERFLTRQRRHELMWTISLFFFALGSLGLWIGAAIGWSEWTFKTFYLFGAILNVPFLALGTVYLFANRRQGDVIAATVSLLAAFAAGIVVAAPMLTIATPHILPQGSQVFAVGPRIAAGVGSGIAAMVIIAGALWSAGRLLTGHTRNLTTETPSTSQQAIPAKRLAAANILIAIGTLILSAGGLLNSVVNAMDAFAISLVFGISVIFAGFLITTAGPTTPTSGSSPIRRSLGAGPQNNDAGKSIGNLSNTSINQPVHEPVR